MKNIKTLDDLKGYTGLVLFSAPWCGPCKQYKPLLERFAGANSIELSAVNIDESGTLVGTYGVRAVPSTFFFVGGSPIAQLTGVQTVASLQRILP